MSLAPLATLLALGAGVLATARLAQTIKREREGYKATEGFTPEDALEAVATDGQKKYNPLTNLLDLARNPFVGQGSPSEVASARNDIQTALNGVSAKYPSQGAAVQVVGKKNPYDIPSNTKGLRSYDVQMCEKVKAANCSAFDDPAFAAKCGICFKPGTDSDSQGHIGGLYLDPDDVKAAVLQAEAAGAKRVSYTPSVGTCPPGFFAKDKTACKALESRLACEQKKSFGIKNCSQCYTDGSYTIVDAAVQLADLSLVVNFTGNLTVVASGKTVGAATSAEPKEASFNLGAVPEGTPLLITVDGSSAAIGGFVQGPTATGVFQLQIAQLADADVESGIRPRFSGEVVVAGQNATLIRPARGKTKMVLRVIIPLTFVDITEDAAAKCKSGPYLTQEGSAKLLTAGKCFAVGNAPGTYSIDCLQEKFTELGCTTEGAAYPRDAATAAALNSGNRRIGEISDLIYENSLRAATGRTSGGQKLSLEEWNAASQFCTGKTILNACDAAELTGTMTNECLDYLYKNQGLGNRIGATYTGSSRNTSLGKTEDRYCSPSGLLSPFGPDGKPQQDAIQRAFAAGGTIQNVKALYDQTHRKANDNSLSDNDRTAAIKDCYGVELTKTATITAKEAAADTTLKDTYLSLIADLKYLRSFGLGPGSGNATFDDRWARKQAMDKQIQQPIKARYVRVKPSKTAASGDRCLQISQLQVFNIAGQEVAKGKPTSAASTWQNGSVPVSSVAVDGNAKPRSFPNIYHDACNTDGANQYWMVDLGSEQDLAYIEYYNRTDCCSNRADGMPVELLDSSMNIVGATTIQGSDPQIRVYFTIFDKQNLPWYNLA